MQGVFRSKNVENVIDLQVEYCECGCNLVCFSWGNKSIEMEFKDLKKVFKEVKNFRKAFKEADNDNSLQ